MIQSIILFIALVLLKDQNMNPLGGLYPSNADSDGHFFAAYNSQNYPVHAYISLNELNRAQNIGLDLMENRLLITAARLYGYPDLDVTEDQFIQHKTIPINKGLCICFHL